ncbi:uncharacterized protein LOC133516805 isoform X2 [Cydia pomonella]|uniref:uncharacterized protein LOC133516805 isoform X2 n=1 Tax=Cydia pomonella TaxID=82600 RepID=UPI002ADD92B0|nr:uncharacterized protein LOC133516805 isoform X2 [Cydia pomonella]
MTAKVIVLGLFFCAFSIHNAFAQDVVDIHLDNLLSMQQGLGLPHSLQVATGHDALMKLRREMPNPYTCTITTPMGVTFDIQSPPDNRFESWSDNCGVRVRNVTLSDEGRWRLTATAGEDSISGWIELYVEDDKTSYTAPTISLQDGQTHANVELTTLDNLYCTVAQPASESSLVPGHCAVTLDRITRAVKGNWDVLLALPGKINELHVQRQISVEAERLDVGFIHDSNANKIHLYCNILVTEKNITFCRFQRTNAASGYNIMDGLSDGVHSYYGEGFDQRHCGMTIEEPTAQDFSTWRCTVGVQAWVGALIEQQTPLQALISVSSNNRMSRSLEETEIQTVFTQVDREFTVMCRADRSLRYCWFQHPNGTQYTPLPLADENQQFWYSGEDFQAGDCGITFSHATEGDAGLWMCHMGPSDQVGVEVTDRLNVRVTGPLAANYQEIETVVGETATVYCRTSNGVRPLEYCRFMTPSFVGLSVDETVTEENAILNRFYFTPGRMLNYGDCSLTISSVRAEDIGVWTCAAVVNGDTEEARDTVTLYVSGSAHNARTLSQAGIAGMVIGLAAVLAALAGVVWYKRHSLFTSMRSNRSTDPTVAFSRRHLSTSSCSGSSNSSVLEDLELPTITTSQRTS